MRLRLPRPSLDGEDRAEHHDSTDQADNVVEERSDGAQLDCSLRLLHEGGISQKHPQSSICIIGVESSAIMQIEELLFYQPVSQAFCEIASSHSLEDLRLAAYEIQQELKFNSQLKLFLPKLGVNM